LVVEADTGPSVLLQPAKPNANRPATKKERRTAAVIEDPPRQSMSANDLAQARTAPGY
jgi:hypothetical protein